MALVLLSLLGLLIAWEGGQALVPPSELKREWGLGGGRQPGWVLGGGGQGTWQHRAQGSLGWGGCRTHWVGGGARLFNFLGGLFPTGWGSKWDGCGVGGVLCPRGGGIGWRGHGIAPGGAGWRGHRASFREGLGLDALREGGTHTKEDPAPRDPPGLARRGLVGAQREPVPMAGWGVQGHSRGAAGDSRAALAKYWG